MNRKRLLCAVLTAAFLLACSPLAMAAEGPELAEPAPEETVIPPEEAPVEPPAEEERPEQPAQPEEPGDPTEEAPVEPPAEEEQPEQPAQPEQPEDPPEEDPVKPPAEEEQPEQPTQPGEPGDPPEETPVEPPDEDKQPAAPIEGGTPGEESQPTVDIEVPADGRVIFNPYGAQVELEGETFTSQIVSTRETLVNSGDVPVEVHVTVVANLPEGTGVSLLDAPLAPETEGKAAFLYAELQPVGPEGAAAWATGYQAKENQIPASAGGTVQKSLLVLEPGDRLEYQIFGELGTNLPEGVTWQAEDCVDVSVVFEFTPLPQQEDSPRQDLPEEPDPLPPDQVQPEEPEPAAPTEDEENRPEAPEVPAEPAETAPEEDPSAEELPVEEEQEGQIPDQEPPVEQAPDPTEQPSAEEPILE